jgi:DNA segregation ATPase FtsK/SpoIIIE-like protein
VASKKNPRRPGARTAASPARRRTGGNWWGQQVPPVSGGIYPSGYYCPHPEDEELTKPDSPVAATFFEIREAGVDFFWWCRKYRVELAPIGVASVLFVSSAFLFRMQAAGIALLIGCAASAAILAKAKTWWNRAVERTYARWVVGLASAWLVLASIWGPAQLAILGLLAAGTIAGMIPWYLHKLPRPKDNALLLKWQQKWIEVRDRLGLEGSRVVAAEGDDDYVTLTLQLIPGVQEVSGVKSARLRIAGAWQLATNAIRIEEIKKDASLVKITVRKINPLSRIIRWDSSETLLPTSVAKPFVIGMNEEGNWKRVDGRGHMMIVGTTRAGKSNELHAVLGNLAKTDDSIAFFIDLKGGSVGGRWKEAIDWFATDIDEAERMLVAVNNMIDERPKFTPVGEGDGDQLLFSPELPAVYIIVDECAEVIGESARYTSSGTTLTRLTESIARRGAAMGFYLVLSGQDGSLETYGTEKLRGQLSKRLCFRVTKPDNAQYVLRDTTNLDVCGLDDGQFFYHERSDDPTPIRGHHMTPADNPTLPQQIATRWAKSRPGLDPQTAAAGGEDYATRASRLPLKYRPANTPAEQPEPIATTPERSPAPMAYAEDDQSPAAMAARIEAESGLHDANVIPITAETMAMLRSRPGFDAEAHAAIASAEDRMAMAFTNAIGGIDRKSLIDFVGMSSSWVDERTKALKEAGAVTQAGHGRYQAVPGADIRQALDAYAERKRSVHSA